MTLLFSAAFAEEPPAAPEPATEPAAIAPAEAAPAEAAEPAAAPDPNRIRLGSRKVLPALLWSLLPGGGHFYLGDVGDGLSYAIPAAVFIAGGIEVQNRNEDLDRDDDEVNVPMLLASKVTEFGMFTATRKALARDGLDLRAARMDDTPTADLLLAPFTGPALRWEVAVAGLIGVAGGLAAGDARDDDQGDIHDVERVQMFGASYDRRDATELYGASVFGVSLGAATAEEGLFRGVLQPFLQQRFGQTGGLWMASGAFGAAHLSGLDGGLNVGGAAWATLAGAYLGWIYDRDGARLGTPIAAHFWYDFLLMSALWYSNPDENPFGFEVGFNFQ